jgi:rod shape-determining protein MreC
MNRSLSRSTRTLVAILLAGGILALAFGGYLAPLSRVVVTPLVNLQTWVAVRAEAVRDFFTTPRDVAELRARNEELEAENARLQTQVLELREQNAEIQVLSALVDFARQNPAADYVAASVIGRDPSPFLQYVIINRGSDDGLRRGMPVVTTEGLVGRIAAVTAGAARVQLITDSEMVVNVRLQNSQESATLTGSLTGELALANIQPDASILVGELILTSGLGGSYPPNLLVGQVSGVRSQPLELFQTASVQTAVDFENLEIVLIIRNFRPVDIAPLIP